MVIIMRLKRLLLFLLSVMCLSLSACVPVADTPADEFRQYDWSAETNGECEISLSFDELHATLTLEKKDVSLKISGICALTDHKLTIFDEESANGQTFDYKLYGDRVELSFEGGTLELFKEDENENDS